jgi:hypothetical protein
MPRLNKALRNRVRTALPPRKCSGTSITTGGPCDKYAVVGATVCYKHGAGAPQVKAAAAQRVTLAEAIATAPRRQPWEIMDDTVHLSDILLQQVVLEVREQGSVSPALLDRLVGALERANRLSKTSLDAGVAERRTRLAEAQAQQMFAVFTRVLNALALNQEQRAAVPGLLRREIESELVASNGYLSPGDKD